jgi:hypothetical protein
MSLIYYNEINFGKDFLNEYNKYCYDNFIDFNLFFWIILNYLHIIIIIILNLLDPKLIIQN